MPAASTLSTLVVDDQLTIRALVRNGLEEIGFRDIVEAEDGEAGLRLLLTRPTPIRLIISDYNMPKFDGLSLLRAVRLHEPTRNTAFIMLTGRADGDLVLRAKENGVNHYLVKPFTVPTLKERIEAVVGRLV